MFRSAFWKLPALETVNIGLIFTWRLWLEGRPKWWKLSRGSFLPTLEHYWTSHRNIHVLLRGMQCFPIHFAGNRSCPALGDNEEEWQPQPPAQVLDSTHEGFRCTTALVWPGVPKALQGSESHWTSSQTMVALVCFLVWRDHPDCLHQMRSSGLGEQLIHPDYYTGVRLEINNSPLKELLQGTQKVETSHPSSTSQFQTYES